MTITITPEYLYLTAVLVLMLIQVSQWIIISKLKREVVRIWAQISVIALSSGNILEKIERKLDEKEDKK
jgi:cation transporter-like permease